MNGKSQLQVQLLWFLMGNQERIADLNICSLLSYSTPFLGKTPHFSSHVLKPGVVKISNPVSYASVKYSNIHNTFKLKFTSSKTNSPSRIISVVGNESQCLEAKTKQPV